MGSMAARPLMDVTGTIVGRSSMSSSELSRTTGKSAHEQNCASLCVHFGVVSSKLKCGILWFAFLTTDHKAWNGTNQVFSACPTLASNVLKQACFTFLINTRNCTDTVKFISHLSPSNQTLLRCCCIRVWTSKSAGRPSLCNVNPRMLDHSILESWSRSLQAFQSLVNPQLILAC